MNYPKRGSVSDDGKYYTHTDGSVYEFHECESDNCSLCSLYGNGGCIEVLCEGGCFKLIEGAYVPADEEQESCEMARHQISICNMRNNIVNCRNDCVWFIDRTCPARLWLAKCKQPDAWEVMP